MSFHVVSTRRNLAGVTIVEVLLSAVLIFIGLGSIFEMNTQSIELLRATHLTAASTQMLQERAEAIRSKAWPEISNSTAMAILMQTPAQSEGEMSAPALTETITLSVPPTANGQLTANGQIASSGPAPSGGQSFEVQRQQGQVRILQRGDLGTAHMLLADILLTWGQSPRVQQREMRVIICRTGLTRCGIFGSAFARPTPNQSLAATQ
jgi:Tfp pilus assembly protein PilV